MKEMQIKAIWKRTFINTTDSRLMAKLMLLRDFFVGSLECLRA